MTYLLDTNICIYVIKNKPEQVFRRFRENFQQGLYISAITLAELEHGVQKSAKWNKCIGAFAISVNYSNSFVW